MTRTLLGTALALLFLTCTAVAPVGAEDEPRDHDDLVITLARYGIHEAGFFRAHADHLAVWEVLKQRAEGPLRAECEGDLRCAALRYSAGRSENVTNNRNRWVLGLNFAAIAPESWPADADWDRWYREPWLETIDRAEAWLDGEIRADCKYRPLHWGGMRRARDRARANRAIASGRWRDAECRDEEGVPTINGFFCVSGLCRWE
ncbi:MAG: hypothetical protein GY769_20260 [bacterium]|nr:hypothetical protein [bacterium]